MESTSGIIYQELSEAPSLGEFASSPHEIVGWEGMAGKRWLHCNWSDRHTLLNDLFYSFPDCLFPYGGGGIPILARVYPIGPITSVSSGTAEIGPSVSYEKCAIEVEYRVVDIEYISARTNKYCTETIQPSQDHFYIDSQHLYWDSEGTEPIRGASPGFMANGFDVVIEQFGVETVAGAVFPSYYCVNSEAVTVYTLSKVCAAETLLYHPPMIRRSTTATGQTKAFRLKFRFSHRPYGWNKLFNPAATGPTAGTRGNWQNFYYKAPGDSGEQVVLYPSINFNTFL